MKKILSLIALIISVNANAQCSNSPVLTVSNITQPTVGNSDGSFDLSVTGGVPPYIYTVVEELPGSNTYGPLFTSAFSNLPAGGYIAITADANGCGDTLLVSLSNPAMFLTISSQDVSCSNCNDGAISISSTGGVAPYTYILKNVDGTSFGPQSVGQFSNLSPGQYFVMSTDTASDVGVATFNINSFLGVDDDTDAAISVYPNPTSDVLVIDNMKGNIVIKIYDINGKVIIYKATTQSKINIDLTDVSQGVYFVKVKTHNGVVTKKVNIVK